MQAHGCEFRNLIKENSVRWYMLLVIFGILGIILPISQNGIASEFVIYSVYQGINLGGTQEPPQKDFFINMGSAHGLHAGSILQVSRRIATYDLSNERLYGDVVFPIALVRVIHVDAMASIARLEKMLPSDKTPAISPRAIMVGDLVKLPPGN